MNNLELVQKLNNVVKNYKTLYVHGCIGAPMTASNKSRYTKNTDYNKQAARKAKINAATSDVFGFDCVCLIKALLWGWNGNKKKTYGGATYKSNGVPDIGADALYNICVDKSTDFSKIEIGEAVWLKGHIGVYIGDGLAIECTPKWKDGVQITAVHNIGKKSGYNGRKWTGHGKMPYIDYVAEATPAKTIDEIAQEVIAGKWYTGAARKSALKKAGYDPDAVQKRVNELMAAKSAKKSIDEIAKEVIEGKWYTGAARRSALKKAGYDPDAVQKRVNELL